jgi:acyl-CoA dehydrogenase
LAFGAPLSEKPLHLDTLAGLQAEEEAAFQLAFYVAELTGRNETEEIDEEQTLLLRLLTPVMKLTTAKQAVMVASEVLEAFGGAGYVEDTGLPLLLRDSQVLPIWEGTTNVLSLDALRALGSDGRAFRLLKAEVIRCLESIRDNRLAEPARITRLALEHAEARLAQAKQGEQAAVEAGARSLALTLGRTMELALLIKHAQWSQDREADGRATAAARRFAGAGIDLLTVQDMDDVRLLTSGQ